MTKKLLIFILFAISLFFAGCSNQSATDSSDDISANVLDSTPRYSYEEDEIKQMERKLAELNRQINQPNILKDDILRGWYLADEDEKKYGTPDNWLFIEDGENSRWVSPLRIEEVEVMDDQTVCRNTAGTYQLSCIDSSESDCQYEAAESHCECSYGSRWKDGQGCILISDKGSYIAINKEELNQGWYFGLPSQRKLNTPSNWVWEEAGKKSIWKKP